MQKTTCYFLQPNTCIIFRLQTQQAFIWSFARVNLPSNLWSDSLGFCGWTHYRVHWLRFMSASPNCMGICPFICTKPSAPLPSSSAQAMLNRIPILNWGSDSSLSPPFLLQATNHTFHSHSAPVCLVTEGTNAQAYMEEYGVEYVRRNRLDLQESEIKWELQRS